MKILIKNKKNIIILFALHFHYYRYHLDNAWNIINV